MSIIDLQVRTRRLGEIRLGTKGDKGQPVKLETFRFTTRDVELINDLAELYGGTPERWQETKWQLTSTTDAINVMIPYQDADNISHYELWGAGGLQRRCNGEEQQDETRCVCDPENRQCNITTRINFLLPDVRDLGTFLFQSHGFYAASELNAAMHLLLGQMQDTGWMPPAVFAVEARQVKRKGQPVNKFVVPVLRTAFRLSDILPTGAQPPSLEGRSAVAALEEGETPGPSVPSAPTPPTPPQDGAEGTTPAEPPRRHLVDDDVVMRDGQSVVLQSYEEEEDPKVSGVPAPTITGTPTTTSSETDTPDESLLWEHLGLLMNKDIGTGTNDQIEEGTRRLFKLMDALGLWPVNSKGHDAFHAAIAKYVSEHDDLEIRRADGPHYSDLRRKEHYTKFARKAQQAAKKVITNG